MDKEKIINNLLRQLNKCVYNFFVENDLGEKLAKGEFIPCCNRNEKMIILECYDIYRKHDKKSNDTCVLGAIIAYYYSIQVFEYYFDDCIEDFYETIDIFYGEKTPQQIVNYITTSNDVEASNIRRKILGFFGGRIKKIKKSKSNKMKIQKSIKIKSKIIKTSKTKRTKRINKKNKKNKQKE